MKKLIIASVILGLFFAFKGEKSNDVDEGTDPNDNGGDISPEVPGEEVPVNPYDGRISPDKAKDNSDSGARLNPGGGGGPLPVLGPFVK